MSEIGKVLVCNRGEIAIRIFRSCTERGIRTVAVYSHEDRFSLHRYKADEAYLIEGGHGPVGAYLDISEVIRIAKLSEAVAIHPGYGFLSENTELCKAAEAAGLIFLGPTALALETAGSKVKSRELAERAGVPCIKGSSGILSLEEARAAAKEIGYPLMLKASAGGGGRGMRIVSEESQLDAMFSEAREEAEAGFGNGLLFAEKYLESPKHIEVQLVGDGKGGYCHLYDRDCSVQRRHQKVVEVAPAWSVPEEKREEIFSYALKLASSIKLRSLATAEFLLDRSGAVYFIEINPRIQVEHTVTEELTGLDLIKLQLDIAAGKSLQELELEPGRIHCSGAAIQVRVTTEDPSNNFQPDYGELVTYRSASGPGIRLDAGSAFAGAVVSPYYDSMLVKVTARGKTLREAASRLFRALLEFRIRGVSTNIGFLENVLRDETFLEGAATTSYLNDHPELFKLTPRKNRANKLLQFMAEVMINGHSWGGKFERPKGLTHIEIPELSEFRKEAAGNSKSLSWRELFLAEGKDAFLKNLKETKELLITDTTFRDAHQSLLATRLRSYDLYKIAPFYREHASGLFSLEMWGGATFDVCMRFLREDPWERLSELRTLIPNILFQALIRGTNAVGYTSYPDSVIKAFIKEAKDRGIDIFRIFDCFNNIDRMRLSIQAAKDCGAIAEVCICYTGDLSAPDSSASKYNLEYYKKLAESLQKEGADILAIKDMAGLLKPHAATPLIEALKKVCDLPIHLHTHDTSGVQSATYLKASEAGVSIVDCALSSFAGVTSQPPLESLVSAIAPTDRRSSLELEKLNPISAYFEDVRKRYEPFESDLKSPTAEVYFHEIPGGQYSNFRPQAENVGLGERWAELKKMYADVNQLLGDIIKVTPSSKVVGDLAIFLLTNGITTEEFLNSDRDYDIPQNVRDFFCGDIGEPTGGIPAALKKKFGRKKETPEGSSVKLENIDFGKVNKDLASILEVDEGEITKSDSISYLLYPRVFEAFAKDRRLYGDLSVLPTEAYFYGARDNEELTVDLEKGKRLYIELVAISEPNKDGSRSVIFKLNGQTRSFHVFDQSLGKEKHALPTANPSDPTQVAASLAGVVIRVDVSTGDKVEKGQGLCLLEAMKMQTLVTAPMNGVLEEVIVKEGLSVESDSLLFRLREE